MNAWIRTILEIFNVGPEAELKRLRAQVAKNPEDLRLKLKLGKLLLSKKQTKAGLQIYQEVAAHYVQEAFHLKAIALYREILKLSPGRVDCSEKLAESLVALDMKEEACEQYQILMHHFTVRRHYPEALQLGKKLLDLAPARHQNRMRVAELYFKLGKEEESLREYMKVARQLRKDVQDLDALVEVYEKVLLKRPEEKGMLRDLCVFYLKLNKPQKAIAKIEKLKLQEDESFRAIYQKALSLKEKG